jgi:hypothetical protein
MQKTTLYVGCFDDVPSCRVHFEPEGAEHVLLPSDAFRVEVEQRPDEEIEIYYGRDSISIFGATRAFTKDSTELKL